MVERGRRGFVWRQQVVKSRGKGVCVEPSKGDGVRKAGGGQGGQIEKGRGGTTEPATDAALPAGLLCARYRASIASRLRGGPHAVNKLEHALLQPCTLTAGVTDTQPN